MLHLTRRRRGADFITEKFMNNSFSTGFRKIEDTILLFAEKIIVSIFATAFTAITG